jgi:hypothetical protein
MQTCSLNMGHFRGLDPLIAAVVSAREQPVTIELAAVGFDPNNRPSAKNRAPARGLKLVRLMVRSLPQTLGMYDEI